MTDKIYTATCAFCGDSSGECLRFYLAVKGNPPCKNIKAVTDEDRPETKTFAAN